MSATNRTPEHRVVFAALRDILVPFAPGLTTTIDNADSFSLDTQYVMKNGKALFFAGTRIAKSYVSFHVMPIYVNPALADALSPALGKRRQGKSCFNFRAPDDAVFGELAALVRAGYDDYKERGYIQ